MAIAPGQADGLGKKASNAQLLGILSIVFSLCCGCVGLILGIIALNQSNAVLATIQTTGVGREFESKANTGKTCGIIGLVLAVLNMAGWIGAGSMNINGN